MKIRSIIYTLLLMVMTALLPTGCSDDNDMFTGADTDKATLKIGLTIPGAVNGETRAFTDDGAITSLHIAVFSNSQYDEYYLEELVQAEKNSSGEWEAIFTKTTEPRRLHFIANYPNLTMGFNEEGQLIGHLTTDVAVNEHDVYWNFVDGVKLNNNTDNETISKLKNVPLVRNYVQIKLDDKVTGKDDAKFALIGYQLYNVPTKGTVAPYNPNPSPGVTSKFANFVAVNGSNVVCETYEGVLAQGYYGNEPNNSDGFLSTVISDNWKKGNAASFIYERNHNNAKSPTCMLVKGTFEGSVTYYKLDFVYEKNSAKVYYNLLRNFIYTIKLNGVNGKGYSTPEEALNKPASNNISADAIAESYTNISDGIGRLFVSQTYVLFTNANPVDIYFKNIPDVTKATIDNKIVAISGHEGGSVLAGFNKQQNEETSGQYAGWRKVTLTPKSDIGAAERQYITFAAGGLQRRVELVLRRPYEFVKVDVQDFVAKAAMEAVDVKITLPENLSSSLFPLRLFISSENNTIFPDYGTNMPAEARDGKYGFIKEVSLEDYEASREITCNFITNCAESMTTINVDNEYFKRKGESFDYAWFSMGKSTKVDIQKIWGRYPQAIYNNGANNGQKEVAVKLNDEDFGTIIIGCNNVVSGIIISDNNSNSYKETDRFTFTFTDYYWHGTWSSTPIIYTATATLGAIRDGGTLEFRAEGEIEKIKSITIPTTLEVTIEQTTRYGSYYWPQKLHNNANASETVTIALNDEVMVGKTMTVGRNSVKTSVTLDGSFTTTDVLTFTFSDSYRTNYVNWNQTTTWKATCTVEELLNGTTLKFEHNL